MQLINHLFCLGPHAPITCWDDGSITTARMMSLHQQLSEDPAVPPLNYHQDPIIVKPEAIRVKFEHLEDLIFDDDTNGYPVTAVWTGGDGKVYETDIFFLYRVEDNSKVH